MRLVRVMILIGLGRVWTIFYEQFRLLGENRIKILMVALGEELVQDHSNPGY
jgi:hypothetical protein